MDLRETLRAAIATGGTRINRKRADGPIYGSYSIVERRTPTKETR